MSEELKKIKKLIKLMKKEGVLHLKHKEIELSVSPAFLLFPVEQSKQQMPLQSQPLPQTPQLTEEEMLFWSSPGDIPNMEQ